MDFNRSICDILMDKATDYFGQARVFKTRACVCLASVPYNPIDELEDFLNNFVKENNNLSYRITSNNAFGFCVNILYNSIIVAQMLQC